MKIRNRLGIEDVKNIVSVTATHGSKFAAVNALAQESRRGLGDLGGVSGLRAGEYFHKSKILAWHPEPAPEKNLEEKLDELSAD